jgi:hypothetical protein
MTQAMTARTVTERWEVEELAECVRCGGEMTIAPHVMGIELGPGRYLCHPCFFFVFDGSKALAAEALSLEPSDDDDGPDGGPAAPAARPVNVNLIAFGAGPVYELSDEELAEWHDFLRAVDEDRERFPLEECQTCRRPASPLIEGECLTCRGELLPPTGPTGPWPDRVALAAVTR